ncbi:MAG: hypothetical protein ABR591_07650 [Candidatus Velthaea sp.]
MAYAFTADVPIDRALYEEIANEVGNETPKGMIAHLVFEIEGGLRFIDVWDTEADHDAFIEARVQPARRFIMERHGVMQPSQPLDTKELTCVHAWTVTYGTSTPHRR